MDNTFALNGLDFSPEINMARYLQSIRKFPILEQDEEFELATRYKETKDEKNRLQTGYFTPSSGG